MIAVLLLTLTFQICGAPLNGVLSMVEAPVISTGPDYILMAHVIKESNGFVEAYKYDEDAVGILQITEDGVREANRICKLLNIKKHFSMNDRWDPHKSIEMWYIIQGYRNPKYDLTIASRIWNSGTIHYLSITKDYVDDVRRIHRILTKEGGKEINY